MAETLAAYHELYLATVRIPATVMARAMLPAESRGSIEIVTEQIRELKYKFDFHYDDPPLILEQI